MTRAAGLLAAVLMAVTSAAAEPAPEVAFGVPAQAQGALAATGATWALLVFQQDGDGGFDLDLAGGGWVANHTVLRAASDSPAVDTGPSFGAATPRQDLPAAVRGRLAPIPGTWSSLYVAADALHLSVDEAHATLARSADGQTADTFLPQDVGAKPAYRIGGHDVPDAGVGMGLEGLGGPGLTFRLEATGVRALEWHNADLACAAAGPCPGGAPDEEVPLGAGGRTLTFTRMTFVELGVPGGSLAGSGRAFIAAAGATALDLAVDGSVRLAEATLRGDCAGSPCPDPAGRTLGAAGNLTLDGLAAEPGSLDRLRAGLHGAYSARFDESPVPGLAVAGAAAALLAAPLLAKALAALFARSARPPALEHPKRRALHDLIQAEPGLSFRDIQRRLAWANGTLSNHMARLLDVGLVVARPHRNTLRYFDRAHREAAWGPVVLLRDPRLRSLRDWLAANPGAPQRRIVDHAQAAWGWKRSTTQDRLRALCEGGLAEGARKGRLTLYSIAIVQPGGSPAPARGQAAAAVHG